VPDQEAQLQANKVGLKAMENISYIGLSQQVALQRQMEVTANNIANMSTPGYKAQNVMFMEYMNKAQGATTGNASLDMVKQVWDVGTYRDNATGAMQMTSNKLDFAVEGEGYFSVQTAEGVKYTRDGSFSLNDRREIVTKSGHPVIGDGGPIVVPEDAHSISMTPNGEISTENGPIGRLSLSTFENPQKLKATGDNLFVAADGDAKPMTDGKVVQGALEMSNVNPVLEMNRMIDILRNYQATQKMLMEDHSRIRNAIQKLTQV
jgi:flagellar basal-body rod protein FlgF